MEPPWASRTQPPTLKERSCHRTMGRESWLHGDSPFVLQIMLLENSILLLLATDFLQRTSVTNLWAIAGVLSGFLIGKTQCGLFIPPPHPQLVSIQQTNSKGRKLCSEKVGVVLTALWVARLPTWDDTQLKLLRRLCLAVPGTSTAGLTPIPTPRGQGSPPERWPGPRTGPQHRGIWGAES